MIDLGDGVRIAAPQVSIETLREQGVIDPHARYQKHLRNEHVFPHRGDGLCACGCDKPLPRRRRRWASDECGAMTWRAMKILHSQTEAIGFYLGKLHGWKCAGCEAGGPCEVDHIIEVADGGGGLWLDNFQLLCHGCHVEKTTKNRRARAHRRKGTLDMDLGAIA